MQKNYEAHNNETFWGQCKGSCVDAAAARFIMDGSSEMQEEEREKYDESVSGYHIFQNGEYSVIGNIKPLELKKN